MNEQDSGGILTEAQAEEIRNKFLTPAQRLAKEKRDVEAKRKRDERAREKHVKEMQGIASKEALWERNQKLLSQSELNAQLEQQVKVWDQAHWVNSVLAGINLPPDDPDYVSVEEGAADLFEFVRTNGVVNLELVLLDEYWQRPLYLERFQGTDPDSIFARLSFVSAMPGHKFYEFEQFLATQATTELATAAPLSIAVKESSNDISNESRS